MKKVSGLALGLLVAAQAQAQAIYRCGNEYSHQPCAGGSVVGARGAAPAASEAQQAATQARRNAALADTMEKERLAREKQVAGPPMVVVGQRPAASAPAKPASAAKPGKKPKKQARQREPEHFTAKVPAAAKHER